MPRCSVSPSGTTCTTSCKAGESGRASPPLRRWVLELQVEGVLVLPALDRPLGDLNLQQRLTKAEPWYTPDSQARDEAKMSCLDTPMKTRGYNVEENKEYAILLDEA